MTGHVTLVGAGCGKGLITLRGLNAIRTADVIVYDALMDEALLQEAKDGCEILYAGKRAGTHYLKQDEINTLLVEKAKEGHYVVRLKGGDSFVFGRGGEEAAALDREGITYDLIPGVTSSVAVPESFGIPVTERGVARSFTVVTGHTRADANGAKDDENYEALASVRGTLVFLMAHANLERITGELLRYGKNPDTPAAVLSQGFTDSAARVDGTLATIAENAKDAATPAILVIGETASYRYGNKPESRRVIATGTSHIVNKLTTELLNRGIAAEAAVSLKVTANEEAIPESVEAGSWLVFTSANGVEVYFDTLKKRKTDLRMLGRVKFAVIGTGTAEKLMNYGFKADFMPTEFTGECLGRELAEEAGEGATIMILRTDRGSERLTEELTLGGVHWTDHKIYSLTDAAEERAFGKAANAIAFCSGLGAEAYLKSNSIPEETTMFAIGPVTAQRVEALTGRTCVMPETYTAEALADLIATHKQA